MDWDKLKREYITTDTSYRKLAEKYGVHSNSIAREGKRGGWVEARRRFTGELLAETQKTAVQDGVEEIRAIYGGEISQARVLAELAAIAFSRGTDYAQIRKDENGRIKVDFAETDTLTEAQKAAVSGIELTQTGLKVKTADKLRALELLGKYVGLFSDDNAVDSEDTGVVVLPEADVDG